MLHAGWHRRSRFWSLQVKEQVAARAYVRVEAELARLQEAAYRRRECAGEQIGAALEAARPAHLP